MWPAIRSCCSIPVSSPEPSISFPVKALFPILRKTAPAKSSSSRTPSGSSGRGFKEGKDGGRTSCLAKPAIPKESASGTLRDREPIRTKDEGGLCADRLRERRLFGKALSWNVDVPSLPIRRYSFFQFFRWRTPRLMHFVGHLSGISRLKRTVSFGGAFRKMPFPAR